MVRNVTTALVATLVLGSAGIASARAPSIEHYDGWTYPQRGAVLLSAQLALRTTTPRNKVTPSPRRWEASTRNGPRRSTEEQGLCGNPFAVITGDRVQLQQVVLNLISTRCKESAQLVTALDRC